MIVKLDCHLDDNNKPLGVSVREFLVKLIEVGIPTLNGGGALP